MSIDDILDLSIEALVVCVALPFVLKFGITPWFNIKGLDSQIEKTALRTSASLSDTNFSLSGAEVYMSLAIDDNEQPSPQIVKYYIDSSSTISTSSLASTPNDGLTSLTSGAYFRLNMNDKVTPSIITDRRTISQKIIQNTNYGLTEDVSLMLHPNVDSSTDGEQAWCFNLKQNNLSIEEANKCKKHGWVYYP